MSNKPFSLEAMKAAFDKLRTGLTIFDSNDRLYYCNDHFKYIYLSIRDIDDVYGLHYEEILQLLIDGGEFAGQQVLDDPKAWVSKRLIEHRKDTSASTERLADGRWVEVKERKLPDKSIIGIWSDITERMRYTSRLEGAMDCISDGFAIWDQAGRLQSFNACFSDRYQNNDGPPQIGQTYRQALEGLANSGRLKLSVSPSEWVQSILSKHLHPIRHVDIEFDDGQYFILTERRTGEGGTVSSLTDITELKRKEHELIYRGYSLEAAISELEMVNDSLERQAAELVTMAEQIDSAHTELKQSRHNLNISEARQRAIVQTMADALIVLDKNGCIETINPNAEILLGLNGGEALDHSLVEFIQFEDDGELIGDVPAYLAMINEEPDDHLRQLLIRRRDGTSLPVEAAIAEALVGEDRFSVITMRDISARKASEQKLIDSHELLEERVRVRTLALTNEINHRKQTEQELTQAFQEAEVANWAKSQFLANMSHELRTPLNCVIGFSEMVIAEVFGPIGNEKYTDYIKDIHMSGTHLLSVISDILDVSKIELGELELEEEEFDFGRAISACHSMVSERAVTENVSISRKIDDQIPLIFADERRIKQILINLLSNAVKFTPSGGHVDIVADYDPEHGYRISVSDNGIGIAKNDIAHVLTPFGRVADSAIRTYEGTGLGLSIAKSFTELHGGTLDLSSELGVGTRISIQLPTHCKAPTKSLLHHCAN